MGRGGGNSRMRDMDAGDRDTKKSAASLRGLSWNVDAGKPAFLRNAMAALAGPKEPVASTSTGADGRPSIPERPGGPRDEESDDPESEEDEWDMGRGEEAPTVVVLKEGRHLDRDEVDKIRAQAKAGSAPDPLASSSAPTKSKVSGSLSFSSGNATGKRKISETDVEGGVTESWDEVIKRSKLATEEKAKDKKAQEEQAKKDKEKAEKKKKKERKEQEKKKSMLSFD